MITRNDVEQLCPEYAAFLSRLKIGDTVAVKSTNPPNAGAPYFVITVTKIFDGLIFLESEWNEITAWQQTGLVRGNNKRSIEPMTPAIESAVAAYELSRWCTFALDNAVLNLSNDRRQAVRDLVERLTAEQSKEASGE